MLQAPPDEEGGVVGEQLLRSRDVAGQLQVSLAAVYKWVAEGRLRALRAGRVLRFRREDVDDFLRRSMTEGPR
jgi:excisionase family DNA binding protein